MTTGISPGVPHLDELPPLRQWSLRVARRPVALLLRTMWRVQLHGAGNLPASGPVILAANHIGFLDGPLLVATSRRLCYALAKHELFHGLMGAVMSHVGQIAVNRRTTDKRAISRSIQVLRTGQALAVFPEGFRGSGEVTVARGGAAYLAMVTGSPVVPVAILGTREAGQPAGQLPHRRRPIHVVFGEPIAVAEVAWPRRRAAVAELTEQLRRQLAAHVAAAQALTGLPLPGPPQPKRA